MGDADIVVATQGAGKIEPLCGVYSRKILPEIENAIRNGHYKILDLFNKVQTETVLINDDLPFYSDQLFYNINRPEDILI
jgi:molybdopterin-guanine dinucleotide biosynthesis protein A